MPTFSLIELFAGIGGAGIALAPAFSTVFANDVSEMKAGVFRLNHPGTHFDLRSITGIRAADLPRADLLWASFPCVDHSALGRGRGFNGQRGSLVFQVLRILGEHRLLGSVPSVVCFENVARFVSHNEGRDFAALVQSLVSLGYHVGGVVLDSELFLPVLRKRLFVVAMRRDMTPPPGLVLNQPDPAWHPQPLVKAVENLPLHARHAWMWLGMPQPDTPVPPLASLLEDGPGERWFGADRVVGVLSRCRITDVAEVDRLRAVAPVLAVVSAQRADRVEGRTPALSIYPDGHVRCITAGGRHQLVLRADRDGIRIRDFTATELTALSGLPAGFELPATQRGRWTCVGDGLCIPAVAWLGRHVLLPLAQAAAVQPQGERPGTQLPALSSCRRRRGAGSAERVGIKSATAATSLYLYPEDLDRLCREAANDGVPAVEWILREVDCTLARRGQPPLRRYVSKRVKRVNPANDEAASRDGVAAPAGTRRFLAGGAGHSSRHVEWYTPPEVTGRILRVLGLDMFTTDAFSPGADRSTVPARRYITREQDALVTPWEGVVFANPPYGRDIAACVRRCALAVHSGEVPLVVGLLPARTDTVWWAEHVTGKADALLLRGRIRFIDGSGEGRDSGAAAGSALVLWGGDGSTIAAMRSAYPDAGWIPRDQAIDRAA